MTKAIERLRIAEDELSISHEIIADRVPFVFQFFLQRAQIHGIGDDVVVRRNIQGNGINRPEKPLG